MRNHQASRGARREGGTDHRFDPERGIRNIRDADVLLGPRDERGVFRGVQGRARNKLKGSPSRVPADGGAPYHRSVHSFGDQIGERGKSLR